tara:strand:- start:3781 stop:4425 length:645 start_codon:yes stop_codon:yes gene_type:complete
VARLLTEEVVRHDWNAQDSGEFPGFFFAPCRLGLSPLDQLVNVERIAVFQGKWKVPNAKSKVCLWFDDDAEGAAQFYSETFPDSSVGAVHRAPSDFPSGKKGDVLTVEFTVLGIPCVGLNGGPGVEHNWAFSFQVATADQAETDRYWNAIVSNGGEESQCGWCKDKWGLNWQITPTVLTQAVTSSDTAAAKRAFEAMMTMKKINIAAINAAVRG